MAKQRFPYTRYLCPCTDLKTPPSIFNNFAEAPKETGDGAEQENDEDTLNPHSPRSDFNFYPLESLVFCNECYQLRCPKCYYEEALQYYCPSCLFETQSTVVKNETNRCTRSCFQCPICVASLQVSSFQDPDEPRPDTQEATSGRDGPCILSCPWCAWTSLEIGIVFEKPVNISGQLAKLKNGDSLDDDQATREKFPFPVHKSVTEQYSQLASFYRKQIQDTTPASTFGLNHHYGPESPNTLIRLLAAYGPAGLKPKKEKLPEMREALEKSEGLRMETKHDVDDDNIIARMQSVGWDGTTSVLQCQHQSKNTRFPSDMRPISTRLRSRRAKRCRTCRYNLVKPEEKRGRYRHQIKLVALNFVPTITVRPLDPALNLEALLPYKSLQFLLTFRNPLFDVVKVTLATSRVTPGKIASRVTVLCPQFEIGANADVWDEALDATANERRKAREALEGVQAEAGHIWDKGRNWTSVIVEVVPGSLDKPFSPLKDQNVEKENEEEGEEQKEQTEQTINDQNIEIPLFVRLEHEADDTGGDTLGKDSSSANTKDTKVKRELAYWCVLAVGRIQKSGA